MGKILPVLLILIGLGGGVGAGLALRPDHSEVVEINPCGDVTADEHATEVALPTTTAEANLLDYVKMNNQFVIPVVDEAKVQALVVLSLSLEVAPGGQELIYEREPKLRDVFLQVLFDHANSGGFDGVFTNGRNMTILRDSLKKVAVQTLGPIVLDVLILDVVRQDV